MFWLRDTQREKRYGYLLQLVTGNDELFPMQGGNTLHMAFPDDPIAEYRVQAKLVLQESDLPTKHKHKLRS